MKTPRTADFDTNTKPLKSSMDQLPAIESPVQRPEDASTSRTTVPPVRPVRVVPTNIPRPAQTPKRKIKSRHPFDIYEDQLDELKQLALEERMQGGPGSMSAMVREAIDTFISDLEFTTLNSLVEKSRTPRTGCTSGTIVPLVRPVPPVRLDAYAFTSYARASLVLDGCISIATYKISTLSHKRGK